MLVSLTPKPSDRRVRERIARDLNEKFPQATVFFLAAEQLDADPNFGLSGRSTSSDRRPGGNQGCELRRRQDSGEGRWPPSGRRGRAPGQVQRHAGAAL